MPMRIAILTNRFPPMLDGVGDYSSHLASELQRSGHKVSVICRQDHMIQEAVQQGAFDIPVFSIVPAWDWRAIRPLRQFINDQKPDWLLVQYVPDSFQRWAMPVWLPLLLWLIRRQGVEISLTFHEVYVSMTYKSLKYGTVATLQRLICLALTRVGTVLITSTDLYAKLIGQYTSKPVHIIPISSTIQSVPISMDELVALRQRVAPNDELVISTFGLRNQDLLLAVFNNILNQNPNIRLLICGLLRISDSQQDLYERLQDRILITGYLTATDVYRYLRASNVFFLPDPANAKGEGGTSHKSTSLAAALLARLPVVGISGDLNDVSLINNQAVALGNFTDINGLAGLLLNKLENLNPTLNDAAYAHWKKYLSWANTLSAYQNLLKHLPAICLM